MRYSLVLLLFFTLGTHAFHSSLLKKEISTFIVESESSYEEVKENQLNSNDTDQKNQSNLEYKKGTPVENNYISFYYYLSYFGVFVLGVLCAIMFFNYKIKRLIGEKFYNYKRFYKNNYGGFSIIRFDVLKILKDKKEDYQNKAESRSKPIVKTERGNTMPEWRRKEKENSQHQIKMANNTDEKYIEEKAPTTKWEFSSSNEEYRRSSNEKKINVLYFSAPDQSGSFSLENSSSTATSRSYYKIEYVDDDNIGKLIYRSGSLDMSALSQMDFILSPVCDIENSSMTNPTLIYVESPGSVTKEGDSWRIQQKIKIKLS